MTNNITADTAVTFINVCSLYTDSLKVLPIKLRSMYLGVDTKIIIFFNTEVLQFSDA